MKRLFVLLLIIFLQIEFYPQACCSAGSPLLGSLDISNASEGELQVGLTYELNSLQDIYAGTVRLDDDLRERRVNSFLLEANYGLTGRISLTALFTFINQSRNISSYGDLSSRLNTGGLSDGIILVKYNFIPLSLVDQIELTLGVGAKPGRQKRRR